MPKVKRPDSVKESEFVQQDNRLRTQNSTKKVKTAAANISLGICDGFCNPFMKFQKKFNPSKPII